MRRKASLVALLALVPSCGREALVEDISMYEKLLYQYDESAEATVVVSKWGTLIRKWRVTDDVSVILYQVDTNTQTCSASGGVVPCDHLSRDRDMNRYIDW